MKKTLLVCLMIIIHNLVFCQFDTTKNIITTKSYGPFPITTNDSTDVTVKIEKIKFSKTSPFKESDISLTVIDSKDQVLYRKNYPADGDGELHITVKSKYLTGLGYVLLLYYLDLPSYPDEGNTVQVFGLNAFNSFVALTGNIRVSDDCDSQSCMGNLKWFFKDSISDKPISKSKDEIPYIEVRSLSGYMEMETFDYYPIYKNGNYGESGYRAKNLRKIPIVEPLYYTIKNNNHKIIDNTNVVVYSKPDTMSSNKLILLKIKMVVKFFEIIKVEKNHNTEFWVHLRINGYEGYVLWDELEQLGFSPR
jgi:hypothetical protein